MTNKPTITIETNSYQLIALAGTGSHIWGGGCSLQEKAGSFTLQHVGNEGEDIVERFSDVVDAVWRLMRLANGAVMTIEAPIDTCCPFHDAGGAQDLACGGDIPNEGGHHLHTCSYHVGGECTCGARPPVLDIGEG
jgi:hypothetical protein